MAGPTGEKEKKRRPTGSSSASKSGGDDGGSNVFVDSIFWVLLVLVAYSVLQGIFAAFGFSFGFPSMAGFFEFVFEKLQIYSIFLSLVFFIGIIYFNFRIGELARESHERKHGHTQAISSVAAAPHNAEQGAAHHPPSAFANKHTPDKRWAMVESRISSFNEGDWRLALLEADIILNEMLGRMGFGGENVAERLKKADKGTFQTLDMAWEAHKARNRIAHEGAAFHLSHDEAKRAVSLYRQVFDEFYFI